MTRYVAFLRAINVGGHRVTMDRLRAEFEAMGFDDVSTYIASGNVLFSSKQQADAALETRIETALEQALGYPVGTYVRSAAEVAAVVGLDPFGAVPAGETHLVVFLKATPTATVKQAIEGLSGAVDDLQVHGRELHWHIRGKSLDTELKPTAIKKAAGGDPGTGRNITMLRKLLPKLEA